MSGSRPNESHRSLGAPTPVSWASPVKLLSRSSWRAESRVHATTMPRSEALRADGARPLLDQRYTRYTKTSGTSAAAAGSTAVSSSTHGRSQVPSPLLSSSQLAARLSHGSQRVASIASPPMTTRSCASRRAVGLDARRLSGTCATRYGATRST